MKCWYSLKQQLVGNEGVLFCTLVIVKGSFVEDMQMDIKKKDIKKAQSFSCKQRNGIEFSSVK